jgi:cation diffusion facilitator family transporter
MKPIANFEYPDTLKPAFKKAKRLEKITIAYLLSTALVIYLTMGTSQAMKTAWFEDLISLTPSISFLVASRIFFKNPTREFPYGYHRVVSIAYLCSALALLSVGGFLLVDSVLTLVKGDRPTIGLVVVLGQPIWLGYLMIAALLWGVVPAIFLGRMKLPLAEKLNEKNLFTDAEMNKADWMTATAAIAGILGIGMGWWWADALAAAFISLDILHDGYINLRQAVFDLMNQIPKTVNNQETDPVIGQIQNYLKRQDWIKSFEVRLREEGHIYVGEGFVIPKQEENLTLRIAETSGYIEKMDWRIHEFLIVPVLSIPKPEAEK